jgi:hypothetical protein
MTDEALAEAARVHGPIVTRLVLPQASWSISLLSALRSFLVKLLPDSFHDQLLIGARRSFPAVKSDDFLPTLVSFFEVSEEWREDYHGSLALDWPALLDALVFHMCEKIVSAAVMEGLGPEAKRRRCASGMPACRDVVQGLCNRLLHKKTTNAEADHLARIKDIFAQRSALAAELVAKFESHKPFAWKIMSMMLNYTRVQSLLSIKKQKAWQAQKRSERANEAQSRQLQATSGFGEWHCPFGDSWDRRVVRPINRMDRLMAESGNSAHFRPCIGWFLKDLTETELGTSLDDQQLFQDYRRCLDHHAKRLPADVMKNIVVEVTGCATYAVAVAEKYRGKDIVKALLNDKDEGDLFLLLHECCHSCIDGLLRDCDPVQLPDGPVRHPARFIRTEAGDIQRASESHWRRLCKGINFLRDNFLAAEQMQNERREKENDCLRRTHGRSSVSLQNDEFLWTLTSDGVDCPKCQLPMERETLMISRSDEGHSVILKCHSCQLFVSRGAITYL